MVTILQALTRRNVELDASPVVGGGNTPSIGPVNPENWRPWAGFEYHTLTRIFQKELNKDYRGPGEMKALEKDLIINNEETLEVTLHRFLAPIVNHCLDGQEGSCHLGKGSRCTGAGRPDWSVISDGHLINGVYANILPGDTKLNAKWWPEMKDEEAWKFGEWQTVLSQVTSYMAQHGSRYGFIITDRCLVCLRLTRCHIGSGLAQTRSRRAFNQPSQGHDVHMGDDDYTGGSSGSAYSDSDPSNWAYYDPEYVIVPWSAHGHRLTVALSLWFLCMMAANGDRFIDYSYPDLDSWRTSSGKSFIHNTSGHKTHKLGKRDKYQDRDPEGRQGRGHSAGTGPSGAGPSGAGPSSSGAGNDDYGSAYGLPQTSLDIDERHSPLAAFAGGNNEGDAHDQPHHSQPNLSLGPAYDLPAAFAGESDDNDEHDAEDEEPGQPSSSKTKTRRERRMQVTVRKHRLGGGLYFTNARGSETDTKRSQWAKVDGGYEFRGAKYTYFALELPK